MTNRDIAEFEALYTNRYVYFSSADQNARGDGTTVVQRIFMVKGTGDSALRIGLGIDCSRFLERYLLHRGNNIPYLSTEDLLTPDGLTIQSRGHFTPVQTSSVRPGDIVVFGVQGAMGNGHTGIVTSWNAAIGHGRLLHMGEKGGVSRTDFTAKAGFFGKEITGFIRPIAPTSESRSAATARLDDFQAREAIALNNYAAGQAPLLAGTTLSMSRHLVKIRSSAPIALTALASSRQFDVQPSNRGIFARFAEWFYGLFSASIQSRPASSSPAGEPNNSTDDDQVDLQRDRDEYFRRMAEDDERRRAEADARERVRQEETAARLIAEEDESRRRQEQADRQAQDDASAARRREDEESQRRVREDEDRRRQAEDELRRRQDDDAQRQRAEEEQRQARDDRDRQDESDRRERHQAERERADREATERLAQEQRQREEREQQDRAERDRAERERTEQERRERDRQERERQDREVNSPDGIPNRLG